MMGTTSVSIAIVAVAATMAVDAAAAPKYMVRNLGRISGFSSVAASDINASGMVTGEAFTLGGLSVGMISIGGLSATALPGFVPTAINDGGVMVGRDPVAGNALRRTQDGSTLILGAGVARGINTAGTIVGDLSTVGYSQAFQWTEAGGLQVFGPVGNTSISPLIVSDINDAGQMVGTANSPQRAVRGTLAGGLVDLVMPPNSQSQGFAINNAGWAAGRITTAGQQSAAVWRPDGTVIMAGDLAGGQFNAIFRDIADNGTAVGWGFDPSGIRATIWTEAGGLVDLNSLIDGSAGWFIRDAAAINTRGQIAATGFQDGIQYLLRLDPIGAAVPEPASWAMLIAGFGLVGAAMRRKAAVGLRRSDAAGA
jgi:hypothetical protein